MKEIKERINNSINFLRAMLIQVNKEQQKRVEFDAETIKILLDLLKDCSEIT